MTTSLSGETRNRTIDLLDRARSGEQAAWASIYRRYRTLLMVSVRTRMPIFARRRFDAEDVLQSAFLAAWSRIETFQYNGEGSFRRWLTRIVLNGLYDILRSQQSERQDMVLDTRALDEARELAISEEDRPSQILSKEEANEHVFLGMARLDEDDQEVLCLRIFERKSWPRVAEILGCSRRTAVERFHRAIKRLGRELT